MAAEQKLEHPLSEKIPDLKTAVEKVPTPENKIENISVVKEKKAEAKSSAELLVSASAVQAPAAQSYQQQRAQEIDNILSEGLNEIFLKMKPAQQKVFKEKGEETVLKINELLNQTKVKVNKIITLIRKWLSLITGINKFFLEQEIKLKTDKIIRLKNK